LSTGNYVGNLASRAITNKHPLYGGVFGFTVTFGLGSSDFVKKNANEWIATIYFLAIAVLAAAAIVSSYAKVINAVFS
jgi:hypothetical protein